MGFRLSKNQTFRFETEGRMVVKSRPNIVKVILKDNIKEEIFFVKGLDLIRINTVSVKPIKSSLSDLGGTVFANLPIGTIAEVIGEKLGGDNLMVIR